QPPEAEMSSPVSQLDSSEARNTAIGAMSEGCPTRPRGVMAIMCFSYSLPTPIMPAARAPSVAVAPGLMEFTRICLGPNSFASTRVMASRALLVAVYIDRLGGVNWDAIEPMLMMLPPRRPKYLTA